MCMSVLPSYVYNDCRVEKRVLDTLELQLSIIVSYYVIMSTQNQTYVLWKSRMSF